MTQRTQGEPITQTRPTRLTRLVPTLLLAIGALHLLSAPLVQQGFDNLLRAGVLDAVGGDTAKESAVWFVVAGIGLLALGDAARHAVRAHGALPPHLGLWVLAIGLVVAVTLPVSPGWLAMGIGALALAAGRR